MTAMSDEVKLSICRGFFDEVNFFARDFSVSMTELVNTITVNPGTSEEEQMNRHGTIQTILDRIGRHLSSLHGEYAEAMSQLDWHNEGCEHDDRDHDFGFGH